MAEQKAFLVNADRCIGCYTCAMACKSYNGLESDVAWRQIYPLAENHFPYDDRAFYSLACNHCAAPVCEAVCPTGAHKKRRNDGIVIHDQDACIGCTNCIRACPFGAPKYNKKLKKAEKCSLCHHRLDAGLAPACIQACPVRAIELVDLNTLNREMFDQDTPEAPKLLETPPGFPDGEGLYPSVRFVLPTLPRMMIMR